MDVSLTTSQYHINHENPDSLLALIKLQQTATWNILANEQIGGCDLQ
jgi:hypothetical protein